MYAFDRHFRLFASAVGASRQHAAMNLQQSGSQMRESKDADAHSAGLRGLLQDSLGKTFMTNATRMLEGFPLNVAKCFF